MLTTSQEEIHFKHFETHCKGYANTKTQQNTNRITISHVTRRNMVTMVKTDCQSNHAAVTGQHYNASTYYRRRCIHDAATVDLSHRHKVIHITHSTGILLSLV